MSSMIGNLAVQVEAQSLNSVVGGFAFASALAWYRVVEFLVSNVIQVSKNGGQYYLLSALFTTLLSIVVFMAIKLIARNVEIKDPATIQYAIARA